MKKRVKTYAPRILALLAFLQVVSGNSAFAAQCLAADKVRAAISEGRAKSLVEIKQAANAVVAGDVIKANLCSDAGKLTYELVVLAGSGTVTRLVLDAQSGKVISVNQ